MGREPTQAQGGLERPPLPDGFDQSRARERRDDPAGWGFSEQIADALWQVIDGRRDIRRFRPDPVPRDALIRLLEAAHRAPSVGYMQPWRFIVVQSSQTKARVRAVCDTERLRQAERFDDRARHFLELKVEGIAEAPIGLCVCCDHGDPDTEVLGRATITDTDIYSTACAIQNLWLSARCEGLGVGWVSFYRPDDLRAILGIPDRVEPIAYLCVGYPDERPTRPGLETAGWASRRQLSRLVYSERFGDRARWFEPQGETSADSDATAPAAPEAAEADSEETTHRFSEPLTGLISSVGHADQAAALEARDYADELVKPASSLGLLEAVVERFAAATGTPPPAPLRAPAFVACADHGVAARGVSVFAQRVSAQVAAAAARGETAIGVLCGARGDRLSVADLGLSEPAPQPVTDACVARATHDLTRGPAMTGPQAEQAILTGAELADGLVPAADCLLLGEIGIANTTVAACLAAALTDQPPERVCGRGTGVDATGLERKRAIVAEALAANPSIGGDAFEALRCLGGFELAALVGAMLRAAGWRRMVVLDGFAVCVAALCAVRLCPPLRDYLIASHRSAEPGHGLVLAQLGLEPLLDLRLRLGEASGAALCVPLIENAGRLQREMATFDTAGVARRR